MKFQLLATSLLLLSSLSPAFSADLSPEIVEYDEVSDVNDWGGFYLGVSAGWDWGKGTGNSGDPDVDFDGANVGVFAGYNHMFDNIVLGAEVNGEYRNTTKQTSIVKIKGRWSTGLSARFGYAFGAFLPYAKVGVGLQDGYQRNNAGRASSAVHTYFEGALGVETKIFEDYSLRGEVVHRQSSSETYRLAGTFQSEFAQTGLRIGLSRKF